MKSLSTAKWTSLIVGILAIVAGVFVLMDPVDATVTMVYVLGILFILGGVLKIFRYFNSPVFHFGSFLVGAILDILFGILILRNVLASVVAFTYLVGFWVLAQGIVEITSSIDLKHMGLPTWWFTLILGILGVICGFLLIGNFGLSATYITVLAAVYLFITGAVLISMFFSLSNISRKAQTMANKGNSY